MNELDLQIITWLNGWALESWTFDKTMVFVANSQILKGGVLVTLIWWAWFRDREDAGRGRTGLLTALAAAFAGILVGRVMALTMPFRLRPLHEPTLDLVLPHGMTPTALEGWSSFPSDHAVLFFALSTGLFLVSKRVGLFALLYTMAIICFPRVYLGLHYPSDILAGALVGVLIVFVARTAVVRRLLVQPVLGWHRTVPGLFYPCFFLVSYQVADMFDSTRALGSFLYNILSKVV